MVCYGKKPVLTVKVQDCGNIVGDGSPDRRAPIGRKTSLIFQRSCSNHHLNKKPGDFHRPTAETTCPAHSHPCTSQWKCCSFSQGAGHEPTCFPFRKVCMVLPHEQGSSPHLAPAKRWLATKLASVPTCCHHCHCCWRFCMAAVVIHLLVLPGTQACPSLLTCRELHFSCWTY